MSKTATRIKRAAADFEVPQSDAEANVFVEMLGTLQRGRTRIETDLNEALAKLKKEAEAKALPLAMQAEGLMRGLQSYCEANRDRLTAEGKVKFHRFGAGEISWRAKPAKVSITGVESVLERLLSSRVLRKFVRVKNEIDKTAMLADPKLAETIKGVRIASDGEDFIVKPISTELEEVAP
jgi:phage host-nuclease inhibitor protein Gam